MSHRYLLATFEHEDDLLAAAREARTQGWTVTDAFVPYAVHGLDAALNLKPSRLTWICFCGGVAGALGMLWFEHWTMSVAWPVNVGGKPWNSLPSDVPVAFEAAVLLAGFGSVLALLAACRLYPGRQARMLDPRTTDDRFLLLIEESDATFDLHTARRILQSFRPTELREQVLVETPR
jgi:Protein of unknown function (DUF3341)